MTQNAKKPTPPVPPTDSFTYPSETGGRVVESARAGSCDSCGVGTMVDKTVATGRMVVQTWDSEEFDAEEFRLSVEHEQTESRVECDTCSVGWSY